MNDQEINRKISELLGWKFIPAGMDSFGVPHDELANRGHVTILASKLHDFCSDLNAMAEAEKMLDASDGNNDYSKCDEYALNLLRLVATYKVDFKWGSECEKDFFLVANATARQRAEAFLRVKGEWKE